VRTDDGTLTDHAGDRVTVTVRPLQGDSYRILIVGEAPSLTVPGDGWLASAEYVRFGPDLALVGGEGQLVLIKGYFAAEPPPALVTEQGDALQPPDLVESRAEPDAAELPALTEGGVEASDAFVAYSDAAANGFQVVVTPQDGVVPDGLDFFGI
jgi:hypothetical protein